MNVPWGTSFRFLEEILIRQKTWQPLAGLVLHASVNFFFKHLLLNYLANSNQTLQEVHGPLLNSFKEFGSMQNLVAMAT